MINNIAIVGIGLVGDAIRKSFEQHRILLKCVDLKEPYNKITVQDCLNCDAIFLCLPSPYSYDKKEYDILKNFGEYIKNEFGLNYNLRIKNNCSSLTIYSILLIG